MVSARRRHALRAAVVLSAAALVYDVEAAPRLEVTNVMTQETAQPNEWIRVTWTTHAAKKVHAAAYWGTEHDKLDKIGEGPEDGPAGDRAFFSRIHVPDHPCTLWYVVHVKDADGHRVESKEGKVRVEIAPAPPDAIRFTKHVAKKIPDATARGLVEEVAVPGSGMLDRIEVRVSIAHPRRGDLSIDVVSPHGTKVRLHQPSKDTGADLRGCYGDGIPGDLVAYDDPAILQGEAYGGTWKLLVADHAKGDRGELDFFSLTIFKHETGGPRSPDEVLPNLVMAPPGSVDVTHVGGKKLIEFDTTVENRGPGPFFMRGQWNPQTHAQDAYQQIYKKQLDAQGKFQKFVFVREAKIGEFVFDDAEGHQHFHFKDWASYLLVDEHFHPAKGARNQIKVSFALEDVSEVDPNLDGASLGGIFGSGSSALQGISVGWADTYGAGLDGQSIDVTGTPDGFYYLVLQGTRLVEESNPDKDDDDAALRIELKGDDVKILERLDGKLLHDRMSGRSPAPPDPKPAPAPAPRPHPGGGPVSYRHEIQPIWDRHCVACHRTVGAVAPFSLQSADGWRSIVSRRSLELSSMERVKPHAPQSSYLWHKITGTQHQVGGAGSSMPPGSHLDAADLAKIKKWIAEGAPDN